MADALWDDAMEKALQKVEEAKIACITLEHTSLSQTTLPPRTALKVKTAWTKIQGIADRLNLIKREEKELSKCE